ncbi:MAG TPA: VWA domain-containing protein [Candidatus Limnocylindrales bacterium]|nr:VWA domain-containing protein [Candidatus Limnocylindrales bacterium]
MTAGYTPDPRDLAAPAAAEAGRDALLSRAARYARWDGTQTIPALDADEILDALADDVMAEGDLSEALRRLMERGWRTSDPTRRDLPGLDELRERLRRRREELQERYQLRDVLADVRQELDDIVAQERAGIERRLDEAAAGPPTGGSPTGGSPTGGAEPDAADAALRNMLRDAAARRIDQLDALPRDVGGRIRRLEEYDFMEPAARDRFNELTERLRKQTLDRFVEGLSEAIQGTTPEELQANRDMVRDLNSLLEERLEGREPGQDQVDDFLAQHGRFFPGARTLDDIVEQLTQRMAAMQSLLRSMTPQQRAELQSMMDALLRDDRLRWDLARLASNLDQLMPDGLGEGYDFSGEESLGLEPALDRIGQLQALDALEDELGAIESPGDLAGLDRDGVRDLLGPDAARDLEALDELARQLEAAGYLTRDGDRLELTPRGSRRIGQKVLDDLFARLSRDAFGGHRIDRAGRGGEREETTKPYEFGDPFHLDIRGTIDNALRRPENAPEARLGRGDPGVRLSPRDFEVFRTEQLTRTSTVLLVDMSRSMLLRGCFLAAKKVAVALDTLIRTQFPHDDLTVIGFAYYARELRPEALAELTWHGYEYGTNLQHGLMLARRILARQRGANRQVVVITDGEPTAHFENGQVEFSYPPTRRTITETLREVQRCTRDGITINTFMLERSRALAEFVALVTRLNRGRAFYATPERLGEYVLVDFVSGRTRAAS